MSVIAFTGFENNSFGNKVGAGWLFNSGGGDAIVTSPVLDGTYAGQYDPTDPTPFVGSYGFRFEVDDPTMSATRIMSVWHIHTPATKPADSSTDFYDEIVAVYELSGSSGFSRRLTINTDDKLHLRDRDEASVGEGSKILVADKDYHIRVDTQSNKDVVYLFDDENTFGGGAIWYTEIDADDHGNLRLPFEAAVFGTSFDKAEPTVGDPIQIDNCAVFDMDATPTTTALGAIVVRLKMASADGTDGDFDAGSPDWNDVSEASPDATDYSVGDAAGEKLSVQVGDADGTEIPLAVTVVGFALRSGGSANTDIDYKYGLYDGTTYDMSDTVLEAQASTQQLGASQGTRSHKIWNQFNDLAWSNPIFDGMEAAVEIITADNSATWRLVNIGLSYCVADTTIGSPADFPSAPSQTESVGSAFHSGALGSANPMVI